MPTSDGWVEVREEGDSENGARGLLEIQRIRTRANMIGWCREASSACGGLDLPTPSHPTDPAAPTSTPSRSTLPQTHTTRTITRT